MMQHFYGSRYGKKYYFQHAIAKYGEENFVFGVLADFGDDFELARIYEREAIEKYQPEYNLMLGGDAHIPSLETRAKIGAAHKGRKWPNRPPLSEETRRKISEAHKGRKHDYKHAVTRLTPERIEQLRVARLANLKPVSEETRQKLRERFKGRTPVNKGVPHKPEVVERMREAQKRSYINPSPQRLAAQKANAKARSNVLRKPVECVTDGRKFESIAAAARFYGYSKAYMSSVLQGRFPPIVGLAFRYLDEQPE